jgi:ferrochelatase
MNLGSPDSTRTSDVRRYLNEFLMDEKVIDMPYLSRLMLVKGIITPFRAPKSAAAYKTIWTKDGSPLIAISRAQEKLVKQKMNIPVAITMRYGNPTPDAGFEDLLKQDDKLDEVIAVPLYPHYAMASYETAVDHLKAAYKRNNYSFDLKIVPAFYNDPGYIDALVQKVRPYLEKPFDHLLFSYHGIPARHLLKTDPTHSHCLKVADCCNTPSDAHKFCYRHQCFETTRLVTKALQLPQEKFSISFQSRLGKGWLEPFTDIQLEKFPAQGIKKLLIISPAFISDCLETLEELEERGKAIFMDAGGETYEMIPCLNTDVLWIDALVELIRNKMREPATA